MGDKAVLHRGWDRWAAATIASSGKPLTGAAVVTVAPDRPFRFSTLVVEQQGLNLKPADVRPVMEGVRDNSLHTNFFNIGSSRYMVTTVDEHLYAARCINHTDPAGAGAIICRTFSYVIIATYEGSCVAATKAVAAIEAFVDYISPALLSCAVGPHWQLRLDLQGSCPLLRTLVQAVRNALLLLLDEEAARNPKSQKDSIEPRN